MQIQISLDPHAVAAAELRAQLEAGLQALERPGVQVRADPKAPAAETFGLAEAYQFLVDCGPAMTAILPLVTAILQLSNQILERRVLTKCKAKARKRARRAPRAAEAIASAPVITVNVNGRVLELPADDRRLEAFVSAVAGRVAPRELVTER